MSRQRVVLDAWQAAGAMTREQAARGARRAPDVVRRSAPFVAPHFVEMVLAHSGPARPAQYSTRRSIARLQADVSGVIESHRSALRRHGAANVAVVVLDNATGEWLAWEGSGNYADVERGGAINGAVARASPARR